MKIVKASYEILTPLDRKEILKYLEIAGRTCYKSENRISEDSASKFVQKLVELGHEAMIEHCNMTIRFICDRGISHEIVRHRIASYGQESTRYCNYSKNKFGNEITVIEPCFWEKGTDNYAMWETSCKQAEDAYFALLKNGATPQEARAVLPTSLKTELITTMNMRAWRNFFKLRTANDVHPQMLEIARPLLAELKEILPELFGDI